MESERETVVLERWRVRERDSGIREMESERETVVIELMREINDWCQRERGRERWRVRERQW